MNKQYAVWIEIEEQDEENDTYETLDAPGADVGTFDTYEMAYAFAERLTRASNVLREVCLEVKPLKPIDPCQPRKEDE